MIKFISMLFLISMPSWAQDLCKRADGDFRKCPELKRFYDDYKNSTIYIGLASPYVKNPVSLFGHNFILVTKGNENLIDGLTFSFEAQNTSSNPFEYITKGLSGGFTGKYILRPIFSSIRLYNNFEDRNLYLYPLKLSVKEKNQLILKMWHYAKYETRPYYFFIGNCAYFLYEFLSPNNIEVHKSSIYFSPQETINRLSGKIDFTKIKTLASIKSEIKNITQMASPKQHKITDLYKNAKFQLYRKYRGKKNNYNKSLLALNKESLASESKVPKYKISNGPALLKPFSKIEIGNNFNSKYSVGLAGVDNSYNNGSSISTLKILGINFNNFKDREYNFTLLKIDSKNNFEWYFKDVSWRSELRYLKSDFLQSSTKDFVVAGGFTFKIVEDLLITVREAIQASILNNTNYIRFYPEVELDYSFSNLTFLVALSREYLKRSVISRLSYDIGKKTEINLLYKKVKHFKENTSLNLSYRF